jgi:group II intron maturase
VNCSLEPTAASASASSPMKPLRLVLSVLFHSLRALGRSHSDLALENIALRQQIAVLTRMRCLPRLQRLVSWMWRKEGVLDSSALSSGVRSRAGRWMPLRTPQLVKRTALLRKLKEVFQRSRSQPIRGMIEEINPILRGWVHYFAVGHSSRCFAFIQDWVQKKVRRHLATARQRQGFGWKRWSKQWLYGELGLFHDYRVRHPHALPKAAPAGQVS